MFQDTNGNQFESYQSAVQYYGGDWADEDQEQMGDHAVTLWWYQPANVLARMTERCY